MKKTLLLPKVCANAYSIVDTNNGKKYGKITPEDVSNFTVIFERSSFDIQSDGYVYYIPKYERIFTEFQVVKFLEEHKDENFLILDNSDGHSNQIFFYIISEVNLLTVYCYHTVEHGDHMTLFAKFANVPGKAEWGQPEILSKSCVAVSDQEENRHRYGRNDDLDYNLYFKFAGYDYQVHDGEIINGVTAGKKVSVEELLYDYLRITNKTRITRVRGGRYGSEAFFNYETGKEPWKEDLSIVERYGLPLSSMIAYDADRRQNTDPNFSRWSWTYGNDWMIQRNDTFESELSPEEQARINARINAKLDAKEDKLSPYKMIYTDMLVISDPIKGHRRPSFHFIRGFRCNNITEIVELSRGEMLMKDMMPVEVYCLTDMNTYTRSLYDVKTKMISMIRSKDTEIDPVSFNKWAEEKSLHPYLLKLLATNFFETIELDTVKTLNKVPFGSLLLEQLITTNHAQLALDLASYITKRAYDFNYVCGKLDDIFPGANGEETSLYKILNISRNTAKYLFESESNLYVFITKYEAICHFGGNLILTEDIKNKVNTYLKLQEIGLHKFTLLWGNREFNFLHYPELAKQVIRMWNKICKLGDTLSKGAVRDIQNKYNEIVRAYASFLDYSTIAPENEKESWNPERLMIFLEFSLVGTSENPLDPMEEVSSREKAANTALKIYEAKANEKMHQDNEKKFATRRRSMLKLRSTQELEKTSADFKGYVVIPPTQIYGARINGSVEKEANDLNHCLFRCYTQRIVEGEYTTMWLRLKDNANESIITIGITADGRIEQTRGKDDRDATVEEAKAIAAWATSKKGLVTFKSEGSDVRPGGWPWSLPVPSLPKPEKNWLEQLRNTCEAK